jgi:hypothetical protein
LRFGGKIILALQSDRPSVSAKASVLLSVFAAAITLVAGPAKVQ